MAGGPLVDSAAPPPAGAAGHMGRNPQHPTSLDEVLGVVALVGTRRPPRLGRPSLQQLQRCFPFRTAGLGLHPPRLGRCGSPSGRAPGS